MAEGGIAAALGNVWPEDNWQVHFRDTMRGGKLLNHWRMAELHAKEAPERVYELEQWGALFDRTPDGQISQRDFGGHRYARLAHVGDRTGLEMIRALQQRAVSLGIDVFMECTVTDLLLRTAAGSPARRLLAGVRPFRRLRAPAVVLATGGIGKSWKVTSNSWECTGDGHALALRAGATLLNMEFVQFHPTGMVWPPVGARLARHRVGARRRRASSATPRTPVHVRLHPGLPRRDGRQRGRGRPLVHRQATTAGRPNCCHVTRWPAPSTAR